MASNFIWEWHSRIKAVELEFVVVRAAVAQLVKAVESGDARLPANIDGGNVRDATRNLEGTYLVRLFAAFESGLRSYWGTVRGTEPQTRDLIDAVAALREIPLATRDEVHAVREYRNGLIHERAELPGPVPLTTANKRLNTYFARLPQTW